MVNEFKDLGDMFTEIEWESGAYSKTRNIKNIV